MLTEYTGRQQNGGGELCSDSFLTLRNTQEKQQELHLKIHQTSEAWLGAATSLSQRRHFELPAPPAVRLGALQGALPWRLPRLSHLTPGPPRPGRGADEALRWQLVPVAVSGLPSWAGELSVVVARHGGQEDELAAGAREPLL